jgi:hypothetical protein
VIEIAVLPTAGQYGSDTCQGDYQPEEVLCPTGLHNGFLVAWLVRVYEGGAKSPNYEGSDPNGTYSSYQLSYPDRAVLNLATEYAEITQVLDKNFLLRNSPCGRASTNGQDFEAHSGPTQ